MNPRRLYAPAVLGGLALGGLAFFCAGRVWGSATVVSPGLPTSEVTVTGNDAVPVIGALALVVAAAAIAVLAASARFRVVVGAILIMTGLVGTVLAVRYDAAVMRAIDAEVAESPAFTGANSPDVVTTSGWPFGAVVAFMLTVALGLLVIGFGRKWPTMGRKYDAPAAQQRAGGDAEPDLWKALDEGRDPTQ